MTAPVRDLCNPLDRAHMPAGEITAIDWTDRTTVNEPANRRTDGHKLVELLLQMFDYSAAVQLDSATNSTSSNRYVKHVVM